MSELNNFDLSLSLSLTPIYAKPISHILNEPSVPRTPRDLKLGLCFYVRSCSKFTSVRVDNTEQKFTA